MIKLQGHFEANSSENSVKILNRKLVKNSPNNNAKFSCSFIRCYLRTDLGRKMSVSTQQCLKLGPSRPENTRPIRGHRN